MRLLSRFKLQTINRHIHAGGIIAYPTEAVYGLGCDPINERAVYSLLALKSRSPSKGLILIASDQEQLTPFLESLPSEITCKLATTWPGQITWLLPARTSTPKWLTGDHSTLACRVSAHPLVQQLCRIFNGPLVSTSANFANHPPCRSSIQVRKQFNKSNQLLVVSGATGDLKQPTRILHASTELQVR